MDRIADARRSSHQIRKMTVDDCPAIARVQARAFFDDPLQVWALPDDSTRLSILERVFDLLSQYSSVPRGESYTDVTLSCAAFWVPPGPFELDADAAAAMAPILDLLGDANARFGAAEETMRTNRPTDPHFYLQGLGTDPPRQRQGLASAAMAPVLARCDTDGIPAYLESTKERNVGFYAGHGFVVTGCEQIPLGGPPLWLMWRDPR
ncbi:MAG TPA: GNAT family N-acetyltransferase [Acidimicrobiia bacterium]|nr:GNAT family N-acetyltransferase [Acidimicrobiia bacterium]